MLLVLIVESQSICGAVSDLHSALIASREPPSPNLYVVSKSVVAVSSLSITLASLSIHLVIYSLCYYRRLKCFMV